MLYKCNQIKQSRNHQAQQEWGIFSLNPKFIELKLADCIFKYQRKREKLNTILKFWTALSDEEQISQKQFESRGRFLGKLINRGRKGRRFHTKDVLKGKERPNYEFD